ncbi:BTAD domain-containing putative transcriptional regulator [Streptomyces sp. ME02-8801-2C]|uniref:AfsR/SARP family transcriptional regulator n=1 Tax=Streptomyces sp. ME02-8801-2C TaxID=3028680 RepID=UPI0029B0A124|nr:BTAD domain-containing putative transcriptional regulator [Streptomyces sp. ME02-8801-2C]MDX3453153.1 BTAD domain-containing putative transcriptional regulator [Streptomyces sp. ME02-8801-2C]
MDVRLLGPVEVSSGGHRVPLNGAKPTAILAALVVHLGEVLSAERLVDLTWEEEPPATARALVASHVSGLRRALAGTEGGDAIRTRSPGYVAEFPHTAVDARRFEEAFAAGRNAALDGRAEEAVETLQAASRLWRGQDALEGLGQSFARVEAMRLTELRLEAKEFRFSAELDLDRRTDLVAELVAHVAAHPLRERPRGQLMTALFRAGRMPDALRCYDEGRRLLGTELGVDPGPELRALHQALLRGDTTMLGAPARPRATPPAKVPAQAEAAAPPHPGDDAPAPRGRFEQPHLEQPHFSQPRDGSGRPAPSQLPPDVADFIGRTEQIAWATALLEEVRNPLRTAPPIGVISGRSGTGKTALAVHVGHRTAALFPDGQLFVDLRASDSEPVRTVDALARLLRALGVDPETPARDEEDLLGLYRTHIARRRVLLILDNAVSEALLRPLLPPGGGSAVLITGRRRLVALEGAAHLDLGVPSEPEALDLLARVAGPTRPALEPDRAAEIVALCGRLPLAVRIAGVRLAARPHWTPARLASRLRDERRRLDELQAGDLEVRASLGLGYADLDPQEQRALRRLALMDLPDFAAWVAGPLLDVDEDDADDAVEQLVDCHFVEVVRTDETGRTRYRIHDLAREYARERCLADDARQERETAVRRLVDRWLGMARSAAAHGPGGASRLLPVTTTGEPAAVAGGPTSPTTSPANSLTTSLSTSLTDPLTDSSAGLTGEPAAWFAAEQRCLLAAVAHCAEYGMFDAARELAATLMAASAALYNQFDAWSRSHDVALEAVRRGGDVEGEARLLHGLGQLRLEQDRFDEAHAFFAAALGLFEELSVRSGRADALAGMGAARREQARFDEALTLLTSALDLYREPEDIASMAHVLYGIGSVHREQGRDDEAWEALSRAHRLYVTVWDRHGEALALRSLGLCHRARGDLSSAEPLLRQSLDLFEETDDAFGVMYASQSLAKVEFRQGRMAEARQRLDRCLEITRERQDMFGEALVLRTIGEWYLAASDWETATETLRQALGLWDKLELPLWRARTLRDLSRAALARGESAAGRELEEEAYGVFRRLGSREARELPEL